MAINVDVKRKNNESNGSILKRFTKKVQESGVLGRVRSIRYANRKPSKFVKKKNKLTVISRRKNTESLIKLGKISQLGNGRR
jgi:ribosomal protein S21